MSNARNARKLATRIRYAIRNVRRRKDFDEYEIVTTVRKAIKMKFIGSGCYKQAFKHGSLVVKMGTLSECRNEARKYKKVKDVDKKYFAETYVFIELRNHVGITIQALVPTKSDCSDNCKVYDIARKYRLDDVGRFNHGHRGKIPVIYDYAQ